ncbi:serine hydrolase domain-containing protein [Stenotrophomonas sp. Iso1]|uniref:serine hydrolase domain-containing protein n=1 Tax=Stenotrophomonas sp. Iso1 TaxID=2977283 RepID=UPI0022B7D6AB|nr:serine hydrolase domain-containing protein [Stenotrophomonas sp. Iso1]
MSLRAVCLWLMIVPACLSTLWSAHAAAPERATQQLRVFLDGIPELGPGYAVVVVDRERQLLGYVRGTRNAASGAPLTMATPMYIASQTKSYMGLLAELLDQRGVLRLDSTLVEHWPQLRLPDGVDPAAWTLADLLNHRVPLSGDALTTLEAYIGAPDPALYPQLLGSLATARAAGFDYDNLGYNIYAAILYQHTGKSWQAWLQDELFTPLQLRETAAQTSAFEPTQLAFNHQWLGQDLGWQVVAPKPDAIMHSAGGMMTSPRDLGRWLRLQLGGAAPAGLDARALEAAHRIGADVDIKARNAYELPCRGYAFGWNVCDFEGHTLYIHGGSYTGARSMMAFSPDLGVGIGVFSNSDNATGWLTSRTVVQFFQYLVDHPDAATWARTRQDIYPQRVAEQLAGMRARQAKARDNVRWHGWTWKPQGDELQTYVGSYRGERLPVEAQVLATDGGLRLQIGALARSLEPAVVDLFGAQNGSLDAVEPLQFLHRGLELGFQFDGERYWRADAPAAR